MVNNDPYRPETGDFSGFFRLPFRFRVGLHPKQGVHFGMKRLLPENGTRTWFSASTYHESNKRGDKPKIEAVML